MKKLLVLGLGICVAFAFASCKSSESAYKKAYEKAKQQETAQPVSQTAANDVTPVVAAPVQTNQRKVQPVRKESLSFLVVACRITA